jgi:RNA polymerase sigma-70 factor (ECF subfamily)
VESFITPGSRVTHESDAQRRDATARWLDRERLPDHFERLVRAAYALCGSREDAEDLVQETYARVLRRPRWLRQGGELAYLMRVLRNVWHDSLNARARRFEIPTELEEIEFAADPGADPDLLLETRAAYAAIGGLSAPLRETIVAVDILGLSYKQAARALGTGEGTIMSRLYNARRKTAEAMQSEAS